MKVSKINLFFRKLGEGQIKHRKLCLFILIAWTLVCLSGMRNFRSESSNSDWIVNGSEIKKNSDHFKDVFGNDQYVLVLVQADDVFAPDVLNMIDRLGERLETEVPFADKVTSLTTVSIPICDEEGFEVKSPFNDGIPTDARELAEKKAFIMSDEFKSDRWTLMPIGYALHYINAFKMHFRQTGKRKESVIEAVGESGWPILFTVITTAVSLLSFLFANIRPMIWLGAVASCVVIMVYLYVVILIPIFLSYGKDKKPALAETKGATKADLFFENIGKKIVKRSKLVTIISVLVIALCVPGLLKMEVNMDYLKFMGNKVPFVQRIEKIQRNPALEYDAQTVAEELGMSISKLNRVFRTMYATSLHSYVQDKRLEYAARLLQENDVPISQAAQLSGYTNMSHFSKSFVKKFGVLPKDY